jgi:hypothetical protein
LEVFVKVLKVKYLPVTVLVLLLPIFMALFLSACEFALPGEGFSQQQDQALDEASLNQAEAPSATPTATSSPMPTEAQPKPSILASNPTATPTLTPEPKVVNPLTGQAVQDPDTLCQRPLFVSVSNFPPSSRPQAGLSAAAQVWETFIGEGMTRFLAVFYGDYAQYLQDILANRLVEGSLEGYVIGPVRSGRVVFEDIKSLFAGGRLITAGASREVAEMLTNQATVYGSDPDDINSAGLKIDELENEAGCPIDPGTYATLVFDPTPPQGGKEAELVRIVYNYFNQVGWEYDPERKAYQRLQDKADGTGELFPILDRLTGDQLSFENVVILWAQHRFVTPTIIEMELVYVQNRKGLLLRDGKVFEVKWSTRSGKLTIHDTDGNPIPLRPGATFFEVVSWETTWDPEKLIVRYHNPPMP